MARVARLTLGYYTVCTAAAVALGILLVTVIEPGQGSPLSGGSVTSCHTPDLKVLTSPVQPWYNTWAHFQGAICLLDLQMSAISHLARGLAQLPAKPWHAKVHPCAE